MIQPSKWCWFSFQSLRQHRVYQRRTCYTTTTTCRTPPCPTRTPTTLTSWTTRQPRPPWTGTRTRNTGTSPSNRRSSFDTASAMSTSTATLSSAGWGRASSRCCRRPRSTTRTLSTASSGPVLRLHSFMVINILVKTKHWTLKWCFQIDFIWILKKK